MIHGCSEKNGLGGAGAGRAGREQRRRGGGGLPRAGLPREPGELRSRRGHAAKVGSPATEQEPRSEAEPTGELLGRAWSQGEEPKSRLCFTQLDEQLTLHTAMGSLGEQAGEEQGSGGSGTGA